MINKEGGNREEAESSQQAQPRTNAGEYSPAKTQGAQTTKKKKKHSRNGFIQYVAHLGHVENIPFKVALAKAHTEWPEMDAKARAPFKEQALRELPALRECPRADCAERRLKENEGLTE